jgi:hypothetical protein
MTRRPGSRRRHRSTVVAQRLRARPGFAMFMALGALVIIAVLVAGSSFITLQESQLGQNQLVQSRAFAAAEYGLNKIQQDWDKTPNLQMSNGANFDTTYTLSGQGTCRVRYTRLNNETFWLVSEGRAFVGQSEIASRTAVKRVSAILRLRIPTIKAEAAVTTNGDIKVQGSPQLDGNNNDPPNWTGQCASPKAPNKPGIVLPPGEIPDIQKASQVIGNPQYVQSEVAANPETYVQFGDETWNSLRASANVVITNSGTSGGTPSYITGTTECNKNSPTNWGEPWRTGGYLAGCINYFPVIFVTCTPPPPPTGTNTACNVHFSGGRGQGILLIDGNLSINGGFEFYGLIIVTGVIQKANGNATVYGSVMAANADIGPIGSDPESEALGNLTIKYSACGVERAMRGSAQVVQAKGRSFVELY